MKWLLSTLLLALASVPLLPPIQAQTSCSTPRQRKAWSKLTPEEQSIFLDAVRALKQLPAGSTNPPPYDVFVRAHAENYLASHSIQLLVEDFLPWHRWFLWQYETALQTVSGTCLTLPFWEWELDSGNEDASAPLMPSTFGSVSGIVQRGAPSVKGSVTEGVANCDDIWQTTVFTNSCLQRAFSSRSSFTSQSGVINRILSNPDYAEFFPALEGTPHAIPHNYVGRHMADVRFSPDDPLFFLHHANVDRIWALWQDFVGHDSVLTTSLANSEFSADLDSPMAFSISGIPVGESYFAFDGGPDYPTPRQVLLNDDFIQVTYVEDTLAQLLVSVTDDTENPYSPNPSWFTLPESGTPAPEPTNAPEPTSTDPTSAPTPTPTTRTCGLNLEPCNEPSECCSNNCRNGSCKGNRRLLRELRPVQGSPLIWANPRAQKRWEELIASGLPSKAAVHQMVVEECGTDNPIMVPQSWMDQMPGLDEKYFRCFVPE